MDALKSIQLEPIYFIYPYYLVVNAWIYTLLLYPDNVVLIGLSNYRYTEFLPGIIE